MCELYYPLSSYNYTAINPISYADINGIDQMFEVFTVGTEGPEKYGPLSDVSKFEKGVELILKQVGLSDSSISELLMHLGLSSPKEIQ